FDPSVGNWPEFDIKFQAYADTKDMLYILDQPDNKLPPGVTERDSECKLRDQEHENHCANNKKLKSALLNKIYLEILSLITEEPTAHVMYQN
ncbi:hypothetical protein HDU83_009321, partial [Entophlyctis luteolus]